MGVGASRLREHANGASPPSGGAAASADVPVEAIESIDVQVEYDENQLDVLATLFTTVKVLFVCGALGRVSKLVAMIDPARLASKRELHTTLIRNEVRNPC